MATYTLTAKYDGDSETVSVEARNDADAMITAIHEIMNRAYPNVALWAKGEITLADSKGAIIQTMESK